MAKILIIPGHSVEGIAKKLYDGLRLMGHEAALCRLDGMPDKADLLISIQCNASTQPAIRGAEAYHWPTSKESEAIATEVINDLCELTGFKDRGVWPKKLTELQLASCPAVVLKVGYISNSREASYIADDMGSTAIAASIASSVDSYFKYRKEIQKWEY